MLNTTLRNRFDTTSMNKAQLVEAVALEADISKIAARKAIDAYLSVLAQALRESDKVSLSGLGTFSIVQRSARVGRNPRTGAAVKIAPKKVVKFRSLLDVD